MKHEIAGLVSSGSLFWLRRWARARPSITSPRPAAIRRPGRMAAPFATLSKATAAAAAGDTVWIRGGDLHASRRSSSLSKSGTSDSNPTKFLAFAGETPVLDISRYNTSNTAADVPAVLVTGNWMHLRGLEIANAKVGASGDHCTRCSAPRTPATTSSSCSTSTTGSGPGLFIDTGNGGNLILNCDSHDNYDVNGSQGDGQNGDGFGVHYQTSGRARSSADAGRGRLRRRLRLHLAGGPGRPSRSSFGDQNGRGPAGTATGFKIGSSRDGHPAHRAGTTSRGRTRRGLLRQPFDGRNTWYNNTSLHEHGTQYNMLASASTRPET